MTNLGREDRMLQYDLTFLRDDKMYANEEGSSLNCLSGHNRCRQRSHGLLSNALQHITGRRDTVSIGIGSIWNSQDTWVRFHSDRIPLSHAA